LVSHRNQFVTSYVYERKEGDLERIREALTSCFGEVTVVHGNFFSGLYTQSYPGALRYEELGALADRLRGLGVETRFLVVFTGEAEEDYVIFQYRGLSASPRCTIRRYA